MTSTIDKDFLKSILKISDNTQVKKKQIVLQSANHRDMVAPKP